MYTQHLQGAKHHNIINITRVKHEISVFMYRQTDGPLTNTLTQIIPTMVNNGKQWSARVAPIVCYRKTIKNYIDVHRFRSFLVSTQNLAIACVSLRSLMRISDVIVSSFIRFRLLFCFAMSNCVVFGYFLLKHAYNSKSTVFF